MMQQSYGRVHQWSTIAYGQLPSSTASYRHRRTGRTSSCSPNHESFLHIHTELYA